MGRGGGGEGEIFLVKFFKRIYNYLLQNLKCFALKNNLTTSSTWPKTMEVGDVG